MALFNRPNVKLQAQADEVARAIDRFASGDLSGAFDNSAELAARIAPSIHRLQDQLVRQRSDAAALAKAQRADTAGLAAALDAMTKAHEAGAIDATIDPATLAEPYREIGRNINLLVKAHIDVKMKVVDLVTRYAAGDFSLSMDRLPGKKAVITEVMDKAKATFEEVTAQAAASEKFIDALDEMFKQHTLGWIDEVIPVKEFSGGYARAADLVNTLVRAHIDVKMKIVDLVTRYAAGDFTIAMDRLPGKKAVITEVMDKAKASFEEVAAHATASEKFIDALDEMSKQHTLGWIDEVIPVKEFSGGYARAADLVNTLVRAHIDVKMKIVDLVTRYAAGDFTIAMDRLPGKKAVITEVMDKAKASFEEVTAQAVASEKFIEALDEMSKQHTLGWIDEVIPVKEFSGGYARAADLVNTLVRAHIDVKMKIVDVVTRYASGDFSISMDRLPGKKAQITEAIDAAKATFEAVAEQAASSDKFISALDEMTAQHKLGWIDEVIPAEQFVDGYKRAANLVNSLVRSHIDVKMKIVDVVTRYVHGDFTVDMDRLPGKKAQITQAIDGVRTILQNCDLAINDIVRVLGALAQGDLTQRITREYEGTFARLKDDSNATVDNLTHTVIEIKGAAETVSSSAREISAGNADLSQRTEQQASSLEETAASIEELTATVRQNSDNARQANQLAVGASDIAVKGGQVVGQVVETMAAINNSAKKIVDIISVIDGIAFQTNILALNAAVEAARAGEQGRGFAVVAGEVRTLAQRSAAAAKEIKGLIGDSVEKTDAGSRLVDQAGSTMAEIVASVKRVTEIMGEIANASQEQGIGIEQVNESVSQMDKATQQNAALVEEVAVSAQALEERATSLVGLVDVFQIASNATSSRPDSAPARRRPAPAASAPVNRVPVAATSAPTSEGNWSSF